MLPDAYSGNKKQKNCPVFGQGFLIAWRDGAGAYAAPVPRRQGVPPCTHSAMGDCEAHTASARSAKNEMHPRAKMKTKRNPTWKVNFPIGFFLFSPDAMASGRRRNAARPVGKAVPLPRISECYRFVGKWLGRKERSIQRWVQGQCPCWGWRGQSPSIIPRHRTEATYPSTASASITISCPGST